MSPGKENVRASSSKDKLENNLEGFFSSPVEHLHCTCLVIWLCNNCFSGETQVPVVLAESFIHCQILIHPLVHHQITGKRIP